MILYVWHNSSTVPPKKIFKFEHAVKALLATPFELRQPANQSQLSYQAIAMSSSDSMNYLWLFYIVYGRGGWAACCVVLARQY